VRSSAKKYCHSPKGRKEGDRFQISLCGFKISRVSREKLQIQFRGITGGIKEVEINGEMFICPGSRHTEIRVAPLKYTDEMFKEVNELQVKKNYSATAALEEVANKHSLIYENFKRQYYSMKGHLRKECRPE
jgi:hypothetical protein